MQCPNCRHQVNQGAQFCGNCGAQIMRPQMMQQAPMYNQPAPQYPQPGQYTQPQQSPQVSVSDPGEVYGIMSIVMIFVLTPVGIILGYMGKKRSRAAGHSGTLSQVGLVLSIIATLLWVAIIALAIYAYTSEYQQCQDLGPGTHEINGYEVDCNEYL